MEKSTIQELKKQEGDILTKREYHKEEIRVLTKDLYNTRQKIKYVKKNEHKKPQGALYEMFGKQLPELTPEELREYHKTLRKIREKKSEKV